MSEHDGLHAELVWDGRDPHIPAAMGTPKADQMQGGPVEQVSELSCRICYDSLGAAKSRGTQANLDHVKEVKHYSVLAHHHWPIELTFGTMGERDRCALVCLNRPGIWVRRINGTELRITLNPRALLEWNEWTEELARDAEYEPWWARWMGRAMHRLWCIKAPMLFGEFPVLDEKGETVDDAMRQAGIKQARWVEPEGKHESWVSIYMRGSRGFSHEQVRHGMFTAVSQRSTRYVDESGSPWIKHPLIVAYLESIEHPLERRSIEQKIEGSETAGKECYDLLVEKLQAFLKGRGADAFTARKQARGAARNYLGNGLQTELIFSASVFEWLHILDMRAADAADAEIRWIYNLVLPILKGCRYSRFFDHLSLAPASDGLGQSLVGGGAR